MRFQKKHPPSMETRRIFVEGGGSEANVPPAVPRHAAISTFASVSADDATIRHRDATSHSRDVEDIVQRQSSRFVRVIVDRRSIAVPILFVVIDLRPRYYWRRWRRDE
jgi:hypothetical protein